MQQEKKSRPKMTPREKISHIADILLDQPQLASFGDTEFTLDLFYDSIDHELRELEEISVSTVNAVRKVQNLRSQAAPGSPAALALPLIIISGVDSLEGVELEQ